MHVSAFIIFALFVLSLGTAPVHAQAINWPTGERWPTAEPESQGMSSELLAEAEKKMSGRVGDAIVIRNGHDVWHYNNPYGGRTWWSSSARSFVTSIFGMLITEGTLSMEALDRPANELSSSAARRFRDSTQLKHLLSYTSCSNPPGSGWRYSCNWSQINRIFQDLAGRSTAAYVNAKLVPALGGDWRATMQNDGTLRVIGSAGHLARWGFWWMNEGEWDGKQLVPKEFVRRSVEPMPKPNGNGVAHPDEGWQIHLNKTGVWGGVPKDCYAALGAGGAVIMACPSLNLVVARNSGAGDDQGPFMKNNMRHIVAAVTGPAPSGSDQGSSGEPCNLINASLGVPQGFGAPWNVLSSARELLISVTCSDTGATLSVGSGTQTQYIYNLAYTYRANQWQQIPLQSASELLGGAWYVGSAQAQLPQTASELSANNFVVAYVCQWQAAANTWKCGCRDAACAQGLWQLQVFRK